MKRKLLGVAVAATLLSAGSSLVTPAGAQEHDDHGQEQENGDVLPMIFVHGGLGSGQQFESQALRFNSNGYPADHIDMFEHNSLEWPGDEAHQESIWSRLDQEIDDMLAATGAEQIVLLGHSQGTGLSQDYLNSSPERAARVAQYINLDGSPGGSVPDEIETLAIWSDLTGPDAEIPGATNVHYMDQAHTEVVNSPEAFGDMYQFVTGEEPATTNVVRETEDVVEVGGRVQLFPQNTGADTSTLSIYEVEAETGLRIDDEPEATFEIDASGDWGPFEADPEAYYEFAITRPDSDATHHIYAQRFVRSNPWVRLMTSEPGGLAEGFWETGDDHANMVILRNKEMWGDQGEDSDVLEINGENILTEALSPRDNNTIGVFVHDQDVDGVSNLEEPVSPFGVLFLTGVDLHVPAADPPDGTVSIVSTPRLGDGTESVCVPNYASTNHRTSVQFNAYHHMVNADGSPAEGHAAPECAPAAERPDGEGPLPAPPAPAVSGEPGFTG